MKIVRILITVRPRMYRETLALAVHQNRPDAEVLIAYPESLDGGAERFRPHLIVRNEGSGVGTPEGVVCWIEIQFSDGLDAKVGLGGRVVEIKDLGMRGLLEILDETEALIGAKEGR